MAAATSKMERFGIIVNGWKPLIIITKRSILDVAAALDPPLGFAFYNKPRLFLINIVTKTATFNNYVSPIVF